MKKFNILFLAIMLSIICLLLNSCIDLCKDVDCLNNGICIEGTCECLDGFLCTNCEVFDLTKIQALLDAGQTPKTLFDRGVPIDSLYGKIYQEGLIFYFNASDGTGLASAITNQGIAGWGCTGIDNTKINNIDCKTTGNCEQEPLAEETEAGARIGDGRSNTDAILQECNDNKTVAKLCRELGEDWFLPSRGELNLMYTNLQLKGNGSFSRSYYWTSTENNKSKAWIQNFIVF